LTENNLKVVTSVAPYVTSANAFEAIHLAHEDGFAGVELSEDHVHRTAEARPHSLKLMKQYSEDRRMVNSIHKTLHRPSIDSEARQERERAVIYTFQTLDYMEEAGISRIVMHSFSDLPSFFTLKNERASKLGYAIGCNAIKIYGVLAPALKAYREIRKEKVQHSFMRSLSEIARYAADKRVNGEPIQVVFEEHYSDAIDYEKIPYGRGALFNVMRGVDTAHHMIRTGVNLDLSELSEPIHYHAVDTNGILDDHRTLGRGKVNFAPSLTPVVERGLTDRVVLENGTRKSALASKEVLLAMIKQVSTATS
jgi:sugar phosphate isomerase/epimerase